VFSPDPLLYFLRVFGRKNTLTRAGLLNFYETICQPVIPPEQYRHEIVNLIGIAGDPHSGQNFIGLADVFMSARRQDFKKTPVKFYRHLLINWFVVD